MPAPKGNEYYKNCFRKMGRKRKFETPEDMLREGLDYFEYAINNPYEKKEVVKSGNMAGQEISVKLPQPFTLRGLCLHMGITLQTFNNYAHKEENKDFFEVASTLRGICEEQALKGAVMGDYNANLVQRLVGLKDEVDITSNNEPVKNTIMFGGKEISF